MRKTIPSFIILACSVLAITLVAADSDRSIPDSRIGLSKVSVFDTPTPPPVKSNNSEPGDRPAFEALFPGGPTSIPHGIDDLLPITFDDNQCIDCHEVEVKEEGEPTPIPESHYVDMRNAPGKKQDAVTGARFNCVLCHVVPGDNPALVGNLFDK